MNTESIDIPEFEFEAMLEEFLQGPKQGESVQVLDGSSRDHDITEFEGDTPNQIHKVLRYISDNNLQTIRPWSIVWNLNCMLLVASGEYQEADEEDIIPIPDLED